MSIFRDSYEAITKIDEIIRESENGTEDITAEEILDCIEEIVADVID